MRLSDTSSRKTGYTLDMRTKHLCDNGCSRVWTPPRFGSSGSGESEEYRIPLPSANWSTAPQRCDGGIDSGEEPEMQPIICSRRYTEIALSHLLKTTVVVRSDEGGLAGNGEKSNRRGGLQPRQSVDVHQPATGSSKNRHAAPGTLLAALDSEPCDSNSTDWADNVIQELDREQFTNQITSDQLSFESASNNHSVEENVGFVDPSLASTGDAQQEYQQARSGNVHYNHQPTPPFPSTAIAGTTSQEAQPHIQRHLDSSEWAQDLLINLNQIFTTHTHPNQEPNPATSDPAITLTSPIPPPPTISPAPDMELVNEAAPMPPPRTASVKAHKVQSSHPSILVPGRKRKSHGTGDGGDAEVRRSERVMQEALLFMRAGSVARGRRSVIE